MKFISFKEHKTWIVLCLDHYLVSQGSDLKEALMRMQSIYRTESNPEELPPANKVFQDMWDRPDILCLNLSF